MTRAPAIPIPYQVTATEWNADFTSATTVTRDVPAELRRASRPGYFCVWPPHDPDYYRRTGQPQRVYETVMDTEALRRWPDAFPDGLGFDTSD